MSLELPFTTPITNILRFIIIEYIIIKLMSFTTESLADILAHIRALHGKEIRFKESWLEFLLVPYRIRERSTAFRILPWITAIIFNALLISLEFGFDSQSFPDVMLNDTTQELASDNLTKSVPPPGIHPARWMGRVIRISDACTTLQEHTMVVISEGYINDDSIYAKYDDMMTGDVVCESDSGIATKLNRISFNISYSAQTNAIDAYRFSTLNVTIQNKQTSQFGFGGNYDVDVSGSLDLSIQDYSLKDQLFDVIGSCTSFTMDEEIVYCYLSDQADTRFLLIGSITRESEAKSLETVGEGEVLRLRDDLNTFRAKMLPIPEFGAPKDGDHLAAVKLFAVTFKPRTETMDNDVSVLFALPTISRAFSVATIFGATSLKNSTVTLQETIYTSGYERAVVKWWALILLVSCIVILCISGLVMVVLKRKRTNQFGAFCMPVNYSKAIKMLIQESLGESEQTKTEMACGFRYREDNVKYGVLKPGEEPLKGSSAFEDSIVVTERIER